jgi:CubicO group peptidase (beta-lactamase class C family)
MLYERIQSVIETSPIPGVSLATIRKGVVEVKSFGVREIDGTESIDDQTVFDAASLTKPMAAYAVLQLVDAGALNLDDPLSRFVPPVVPDDPASASGSERSVIRLSQ